jgi:hypothetical protein
VEAQLVALLAPLDRRRPARCGLGQHDAYGWRILASRAARLKNGAHTKILGYDGYTAGFHRFYLFRCSRHGGLITCRNALGDAMRYRPR